MKKILTLLLIIITLLPLGVVDATPPEHIRNNRVYITIPAPNATRTHYQVSVDGANWGNWIEIMDDPVLGTTVPVYLPTGDGRKMVFFRTGRVVDRMSPIYDLQTEQIVNVRVGERIIANSDTQVQEFVLDLEPPKILATTPNNLWVAQGGSLLVLAEITDNLDSRPRVEIELLLGHAGIATPGGDVVFKVAGYVNEGTRNLVLPLSGLNQLNTIDSNGRKRPIHLRITATDASGNRNIRVETIYVKS